jgi:hypothetical protein
MPPVPDTVPCANMWQKELIRKSRVPGQRLSGPKRACHIHRHVTLCLARDQAKSKLNVEAGVLLADCSRCNMISVVNFSQLCL